MHAIQHENDVSIVQADAVYVETLTYGQTEDLDNQVAAEIGSYILKMEILISN